MLMRRDNWRASFGMVSTQAPHDWESDRERLRASFLDVLIRHPLITISLAFLYGVLVFGGVLQ